MSQYKTDPYESNYNLLSAIGDMETNFEYLRTSFSGTSAPTVSGAGQVWFDTNKNLLKIRNTTDTGWMGVMCGNESSKVWIWENVARNGWIIDSSVTDCLLALKGGSQDYNVDGGTVSGTWTQTDCTLTLAQLPIHDHGEAGLHKHSVRGTTGGSTHGIRVVWAYHNLNAAILSTALDHTHDTVGDNQPHYHNDTWRPLASVGTLQYHSN